MILGINGIRLCIARTGVGRAIESILRNLDREQHPFTKIRVYTPIPLEATITLPRFAENVVLQSSLPLGLWEQIVLPLAHGKKHLLYCPSYVAPLFANSPVLLTHHGSYEGYPEGFPWWSRTKARLLYQLSARTARAISTVSEHSKLDIVRFYGINPDKITVIPAGVDTHLFRPIHDSNCLSEWRHNTLGADVPFFLYVGKPTKRRNLPHLLKAFAALKRKHDIPHKLLLIGTNLPGSSFEHVILEEHIEENVVSVSYATHEMIVMAYNACEVLLYPSSYEGFGMPVLEAMACGAPVIALNNTAFPEFSAGIANLLDDAEISTLQNAMENSLDDCAWKQMAAIEGPRRAADYDWQPITRRYIDWMSRSI